jgi:hypothetical protein
VAICNPARTAKAYPLAGDPAPNAASVAAEAEEDLSLLDQIKLKAVEGIKGFMIGL